MQIKEKLTYSALIAPLFMYFEPYSILVKAIGVLVVFDIVSGVLASRKEGIDFQTRKLLDKFKPLGLFLFALAAAKEANPLLMEFSIESHQAGKWICSFYGVYELLSILENLGRMGLPVAKPIMDLLKSKLPKEISEIPQNPIKEES
jgi:phage-related holin